MEVALAQYVMALAERLSFRSFLEGEIGIFVRRSQQV
jgi:hypothetical protein